jgi:hypothetical protein
MDDNDRSKRTSDVERYFAKNRLFVWCSESGPSVRVITATIIFVPCTYSVAIAKEVRLEPYYPRGMYGNSNDRR